jgi:ankyrin repeat protein
MRSTLVRLFAAALLAELTSGLTVPVVASTSLFDALRRDDRAAIATALTQDGDVNAVDESGATPLMYAVIYSKPAVVELLLTRGASVNAANKFGATALMWAAPRTPIVQMLLAHGADVNARASDGTTALVVAARVRNVDTMRLMVAAGADLKSPVTRANLLTAAYAPHGTAVRDFLASQQIVLASASDLKDPVLLAANSGNARVFEQLLAIGVDPHQRLALVTVSMPTFFGLARRGQVDAIRTLQKANVDLTANGGRGWTALMLAAADETPSIPVMRLLLDAGVDVNAQDDEGRTALDWALTRGETEASAFLRKAGGKSSAPPPAPTRSIAPYAPNEAVARAVSKLQPAGPAFTNYTKCISCHNQSLPSIAVDAASKRAVPVDSSLASHSFDVTQQNWRTRRETALLGQTNRGGFQASVAYGLFDMAETGRAPTPLSDAMVLGLASRQVDDGSWPVEFDIRPPLTLSPIAATALALRGIKQFAPPGRREELTSRISRAVGFLRRSKPADTQDQAFKLLGLLWTDAPSSEIAREQSALIALRRPDGGWGQMPSMASDAYATGQALFALRAAGTPVTDAVYRNGVSYLLATQLEDGTWFVRTRAFGFQPYFETGFPHGRSQFISTAATAWAAAAIAYSLEE